jgi:hypothetical protein
VSAIPRRPIRNPDVRSYAALLTLTVLFCAGCRLREPALRLHYLPGFVPGTRNVFAPATIAIAPPGGKATQDRLEVGGIFDPDGKLRSKLHVRDLRLTLAQALACGLKDAGLSPIVLNMVPRDLKPPGGGQFLLIAAVEDVHVDKRFGPETTVHGRYFTMHARVRISAKILDYAGRQIFLREVSGTEDEPPAPVGAEAFLPLETDPAESLSVALSRAVGALIIEPDFRRLFPPRA